MIIFESSSYDANSVGAHLGKGTYSYAFVRRAFGRLLDKHGERRSLPADPLHARALIGAAKSQSLECIHLAYAPLHDVMERSPCPTIPVFAWEFETIPTEAWGENPRNDWRLALRAAPFAITHSAFAAQATKDAMGGEFAVWSIPAPIHDLYHQTPCHGEGPRTLRVNSAIFDANALDLSIFSNTQQYQAGQIALNRLARRLEAQQKQSDITLDGVVYTAVFNPVDGRKNWTDLIAGFVWALRDVEDATLVLKVVHHSMSQGLLPILNHIQKLKPFKCRIVVLSGMLSDAEYRSLIEATTYAVNTSTAEGQCLPLMEFMSAGRPALAPRHSALAEYVTEENAFVIGSESIPTYWPHDPRRMMRCHHHRPFFTEIQHAYIESYRTWKNSRKTYKAKSEMSREALKVFCSDDVIETRLREALASVSACSAAHPEQIEEAYET